MKHKIRIALFIIAVFLPFLILTIVTAFLIPPQYDKTFLGALSVKYERLKSIDAPKIILVGGSNLAFGIDSKALETYTGMPTVNFGLYASLGTKAMMDLSKSSIHRGDIVVLCPEMDKQTLSLYYNGETMWQAIDENYGMLFDAGFSNYGKLLGAFPAFAAEKYKFSHTKSPDPKGVYRKDSFNKIGDINYKRPYNSMQEEFDETHPIDLSPDIIDDDFIDYVNRYAQSVKLRGAKLYFSFAPMDQLSLVDGTDESTIEAFYRTLGEKLDVEIISNINDYILDEGYFYDTNFHLNDTGVKLRTSLLAGDILRTMQHKKTVKLSLPDPPIRPDNFFETVMQDDTSGYFTYKQIKGGVSLSGVTDKGLTLTEISIPASFEGKPVLTIEKGAFAKCALLKTIIIGEKSNLKKLSDGNFAGCKKLMQIKLHLQPAKIAPSTKVLEGTPEGCKFYIPSELYGDFATDYFWSQMMPVVTTFS